MLRLISYFSLFLLGGVCAFSVLSGQPESALTARVESQTIRYEVGITLKDPTKKYFTEKSYAMKVNLDGREYAFTGRSTANWSFDPGQKTSYNFELPRALKKGDVILFGKPGATIRTKVGDAPHPRYGTFKIEQEKKTQIVLQLDQEFAPGATEIRILDQKGKKLPGRF